MQILRYKQIIPNVFAYGCLHWLNLITNPMNDPSYIYNSLFCELLIHPSPFKENRIEKEKKKELQRGGLKWNVIHCFSNIWQVSFNKFNLVLNIGWPDWASREKGASSHHQKIQNIWNAIANMEKHSLIITAGQKR